MSVPSGEPGDISEAELLNMPDHEYMGREQLAFFRKLLLEQRRELLEAADASINELRERPVFPDDADRASSEEEFTLLLRLRDRERKLLPKINQALSRIDQGTYGWCEQTGEPIGLRRLLARPTATLSVEGQELKEARERHYTK
ncbi:RNA polymerase-binding protein DksA [Aquisalimonas asiatica]|uniref:RNA polymerase-binding transcription factor DksA n=1 Tax=Aquisalimonas asiatica TaxID=406100 RepID=A0A1H8SX87_9GAMM|nr:RNA polymerase-binding protein DksA [Aquisalimonas asiatica]SEO83155.1 transcriptional regulator, TraR/DksA family [Aquisalimonas asiatica]